MQITNQPNPMTKTNEDKISIAAQFLFSKWNEKSQSCIYRDDATDKDYVCNSKAEMIDLYDLIKKCSQDAFNQWCVQTTHDEIAD